jgi:hypothetical protein
MWSKSRAGLTLDASFSNREPPPLLTHKALARIRRLYAIERTAKECSAENCHELHQRESVPFLLAMQEWLITQSRQALPRSPVGQAIGYARSNWEALCRSTEDVDLSIEIVWPRECFVPKLLDAATGYSWGATGEGGRRQFCSAWQSAASDTMLIPLPTWRTSFVACPLSARSNSLSCFLASGSRDTPQRGGSE